MEKICSCFGHSDVQITEELKNSLTDEVRRAVTNGITIFLFGGLGNFDSLCYDAVSEVMQETPQSGIKRIFCFALEKQLRKHPSWYVPKTYEEFICLPMQFDYWYTSIYFRNCAMIDKSDLVLFFVDHDEESSAYKLLKYAKAKKKNIINLGTTSIAN